jgi:diguanylate cyclase (GGDEF)-like protein
MRRACRAEDIVARLGGDEFGILLLRADAQSVGRICERILHLQTLHNINHPELPLSLSIGMATAAGNRELQDLFSRADEDMYRKRRHRRHVRPVARKYWGKRNPRRR